jgi:hypothetical protein
MGDESASIVMIAGANCNRNEVRQLPNGPSNFTRLLFPGFGLEHVEQITGNANKVKVWSLFNQPAKPVKTEMASSFRKMVVQSPRNVIMVMDREGSDAITMLCFSPSL